MKIVLPSDESIREAFGISQNEPNNMVYAENCSESGDCTGGICDIASDPVASDMLEVREQKETIEIHI